MLQIPLTNIVTTNEDYHLYKARHPGRSVSIEISGTFDGAIVTPGYVTSDVVPEFVIDVGDDDLPRPKTAAGRWVSQLPASGLVGFRLEDAGGATSLLVKIIDLKQP